MFRRWVLSVGVLALAAPSSAELILRSVSWQLPAAPGVRPRGFKPIERWIQPPAANVASKPRAVVTVTNRGPKAADGVVLRYTLSARQARIDQPAREGIWTVPFYLSERRLSRVKPNATIDVPINDLVLGPFLKKCYRAGYWPDALKIHIMVEPRSGEGLEQRLLDETLPVVFQ